MLRELRIVEGPSAEALAGVMASGGQAKLLQESCPPPLPPPAMKDCGF